jgi:DNA-binding transcriptional regulator YiaG
LLGAAFTTARSDWWAWQIPNAQVFPVHSTLDSRDSAWDGSQRSERLTRFAAFPQFGLSDSLAKSRRKMKVSGAQVKAARELLKITQPALAEASGVSERTLQKFEVEEALPKPATLDKILGELERRGIEFTNGSGIGVRLNFDKAAAFARTVATVRKEPNR